MALTGSGAQVLTAQVNQWTGNVDVNWGVGGNWSDGVPSLADDLIFSATPGALISLGSGSLAGSLWFQDNYGLTNGDLTLETGLVRVNLGHSVELSSQLSGANGLTLTGGGSLRLSSNLNDFMGEINISGGSLIISSEAALGLTSGAINVTSGNATAANLSIVGFLGGSLVLDGSSGGFELSRDLNLEGRGPIGNNGSALLSYGDNTLSGVVTTATSPLSPLTIRNTRFSSANGILRLSGTLNVLGTAGTTVTTLGGANQAGIGNYELTGVLAGTGTLEKSGGGTFYLEPSDTSGFSGRIRVSGSAALGQSSVRVGTATVFGTANSGTTSAPVDMNGGILEIRSDASLDFGKNVYQRATSTMFVGPSASGFGVNGVASFGTMAFEDNLTTTFNSRNGYGMSFTAAPVVGTTAGDNNSTLTNNMGGTLTFAGAFWSNANNTGNRLMTIGGNGNTTIDGSIIASAASFDHSVTKTGAGVLSITGTATTLDGAVNINGGAVAITDFRSVNNNAGSGAINIGTGSTAGALIIGTGVMPTAGGLISDKAVNIASTTGTASLYANQQGTNPVILSNLSVTGNGAKTLVLGGTNTADNTILSAINDSTGVTSLIKIGPSTWSLAGANGYTGVTTLANGVLKLQANSATSTVLGSGNTITFNANSGFAGARLEFVGQDGVNNVQNLGTLNYAAAGANTVRVTPGALGTASLVFANVPTGGAGTLNIVGADFTDNQVVFTQINAAAGSDGIITRSIYWNGADYAYRQGGVLRAPEYGVDGGTSTTDSGPMTSGSNVQITGSFNTGALSVATLKIAGSQTLTLNPGSTLTLSSGGLLATGGEAVISGGTLAMGSQAFVVRVNEAADTLTLATAVTGTGGLTKSGAGTLIMDAASSRTGTTSIDEGTVQLSGSGTLSGANVTTNIRQNGVLDLNGVGTGTSIGQWNNNGLVTNSSSSTTATLTVGNNNGTGTSWGVVEDGVGTVNVTKVGTGAQTWLGNSTYTGVTQITGLVTVQTLADGGSASAIGAATNSASNLVFNGAATTGLVYQGNLTKGILNLGSTSATTDRLFTVTGAGVTMGSTQTTNLNNAFVWSNPGAIVHGGTAQNRLFTFNGTSQGDNTFNPQITDPADFVSSVTKTGTGIWRLSGENNTYSGPTLITQGILMAEDGKGLSSNSNLQFDGGTLYSQGLLSRNIGTGAGQMQFLTPAANTAQFAGGFLGGDSKLTVLWSGTPVWGGGGGFLDTRDGLMLNGSQARAQGATASNALSEVEIAGDFSLGTATATGATALAYTLAQNSATVSGLASTAGLVVGQSFTGTNVPSGAYIVSINSASQITLSANTANTSGIAGNYTDGASIAGSFRSIRVDDNGQTGADFATISGVISAGDSVTGLRKVGSGTLKLTGANTYTGLTEIYQGALEVLSLGQSGTAGATSVGDQLNAHLNASAITLGNGGTGGAILQYVGAGEISNRKIRINSTTGTTQIHTDGTGPLVLTNVANDMASGAKTLQLRGTNTAGNMITSQLSDNGGALALTIDSNATWILTHSANDYSGLTTVSAGALGIGHDGAIGGALTLSNGNVFAYGGDRTLSNTLNLNNNATSGFLGDYSLTFNGTNNLVASANNVSLNNSLVEGAAVTFNGLLANSLTANRAFTLDGPGVTVINGDFTTSTAFGVAITKNGDGTLILGTNGGTSNWNQASANLTLNRGTLAFSASNAIPTATVANGGLIINPALNIGSTATVDLSGTTQTVNALTAITDGTVIIDNTSVTAAVFRFGENDSAVNFGSGLGTYSIQNTGAGPLSIIKLGNSVVSFGPAVGVGNAGTIANDGGGSFTLAGPVTAATGLRAISASTLALTGGISNPGNITTIEVGGGSTLSLLDGAGSAISNLTTLNLGNTGSGTVTLNLNVGDLNTTTDRLNTDRLTLLTGGTLNLGNTITFNLTDAGLNAKQTYTLLNLVDGGLSSFGLANLIQGATPGGFDDFTWFVDNNVVQITTGNLLLGDLYWRGLTDTTWNANANNWSENKDGTGVPLSIPGQGNNVIFAWDDVGSGALTTTLEQNFRVNSLLFEAGASTPSSVTIDPGAAPGNRLEVAPQNPAVGISITSGGPASVNISTNLKIGADQTWGVADAGATLTLSGSLLGEAQVTKTGRGRVILSGVADPTFNSGTTTTLVVEGGTLEITNSAALGTTANGNVASIEVNGGAYYYNNATAGTAVTLPHPITLNGGTLSGGGATHVYGGLVTVNGSSTINLADLNGAPTAAARSITLGAGLIGSGDLTLNGNNTVGAGNQISGTLTLNQDNSAYSGNWTLLRGSLSTNQENGLGLGDSISAEKGRILFTGTAGSRTLGQDIIVASATENALLELNQASGIAMTYSGAITLGGAGGSGELRVLMASDAGSALFTGDVSLVGNGLIGTQNSATRVAEFSGVISESGGARTLRINDAVWGGTPGTVRLTGANTFTGNVTVVRGILEYDTITNIGGAASSLGQGSAINMEGGNLRFIGNVSQSTDRPISATASATLSAHGTEDAKITYNGAITMTANAILTLSGTAEGVITGGITQPAGAASADLSVTSGTWTIQDNDVSIADDLLMSGGTLTLKDMVLTLNDDVVVTAGVLNLNNTGILAATNPAGTSSGLHMRNGGVINLNTDNVWTTAGGLDFINVGDATAGAAGILNTNTFAITSPGLLVGGVADGLEGVVSGTGTITVTSTAVDWSLGIRLYRGSVSANLAGVASLLKQGLGEVTLSGDNSGLTGTVAASRLDAGTLILDYSVQNNAKISTSAALDLRGAAVTLLGNSGAATAQSVASTTLANASGANRIELIGGVGQDMVFNLGAITRAVNSQDGTLRIVLPAGVQSATNGVLTSTGLTAGLVGTAAYLTVEDSTGTWFATKSGDNIVPLLSTIKNDVSSWVPGDHVTDSAGGFSGTFSSVALNSLRFDAAGGSVIQPGGTGVLGIVTGGILITGNVTGAAGISSGTLFSGAAAATPEIIVTHDGAETFEIGANLRVNTILIKTGPGTLQLSGNNTTTGLTEIQNGILQISGGNAIGNTSLVSLSDDKPTQLQLLASETIGRLAGGSATAGLSHLAVVDIGSHTLTLNQTATSTYSGSFTGNGTLVKSGASTFTFNGTDPAGNFTGALRVEQGQLLLSGATNQFAGLSNITLVGSSSTLRLNNDQTTAVVSRIGDSTSVTLHSTAGTTAASLGFYVTRTAGTTVGTETVGQLILGSGHNTLAVDGTGTDRVGQINFSAATPLARENFATLLVVGRALGTTSGQRGNIRFTSDPGGAVGGGGAAGGSTISIFPYMVGETTTVVPDGSLHFGNSFVRYVSAAVGVQPLNLTTEYVVNQTAYDALSAGVLTNNVRFTTTTGTLASDTTGINSLILDHATGITVTGPSQAWQITSGAVLSASAGANVLDGFTGITTGAGSPYQVYVTHPSGSLTLASPLISAVPLVKAGAGTLILEGVNDVVSVYLNQGAVQITDLDNIGGDTGALVFAGGTLRIGAGFTDDVSTRSITFLEGGGTLDTQGHSVTLAGSLGSGVGGFTKAGVGNLTLNGTATYTGPTLLSAGTLTIGAANALGSGGDLTLSAGTTLALGTGSLTHGQVAASGAGWAISGTGTLTVTTGFNFNTVDASQIDALLAGTGGLFKNGTQSLTLTGLSTYSGTTEVQAGALIFDSLSSIGGGPSALGNAANPESGIIRMGLTTAATTLTYTGVGHVSDRVIGMQGTTGGVTLNGNGTGGIGYGGARFEMAGNKTLTLGGTSDAAVVNSIGVLTEVGGVMSVLKTDANTWALTSTNTYTGSTSVNNGVLRLSAGQSLPGALNFGSASSITTAGSVEVEETAAFGSLVVQTNSAANTNLLSIAAGKTLEINGNATVGSGVGALSTTLFHASGAGELVISNAASAAQFRVGGSSGSGNVTLADMSGLAALTVSLNTTDGIIRVNSSSGTNVSNTYSVFRLAVDSDLTAATLAVGDGGQYNGSAGQINRLLLGTGDTRIQVNTINIGTGTRDLGEISFQDANGTLVIRAADGLGATAFNMGAGTSTTGVVLAPGNRNTFDVTGHDADLLLGAVNIGTQNGRTGAMENLFAFDQGTLVAGNLLMGTKTAAGNSTNVINLGGGVVAFGSGTGTAVTLGSNTNTGAVSSTINVTGGTVTLGSGAGQALILGNSNTNAAGSSTGALNISGGDVTLATTGTTAATLANAAAGTSTGSITLTGGSLTVQGDILSGAGAGTRNAVVTLNGGLLDMTGKAMGASGNAVIFEAQSGRLQNLGELNGGALLTKTTAGMLELLNGNTYSGGTQVDAGTLLVNNTLGSGTGSGNVTVDMGGALAGAGIIASSNAAAAVAIQGLLDVGNAGDLAGSALTVDLSGTGSLFALSGVVQLDLWSGLGTGGGTVLAFSDLLSVNASSIDLTGSTLRLFNSSGLGNDIFAAGDSWKLFDWTTVAFTGSFSNITSGSGNFLDLPNLDPYGLAWDTSALYTTGHITVAVPEPGRVLLLLLGLASAGLRRRRSSLARR